MTVKSILKTFDFLPEQKEMEAIKRETYEFVGLLKDAVRKDGIDAQIFVGGSLAKGTLAESEEYDVDVFVRFDWKYKFLSKDLEKVLKKVVRKGKYKCDKIHGSRDYFRVYRKKKLTFEVIPVVKVRNVREARNVTDLSYFHVNYVRRNLKRDTAREILFAKKFCKARGVYGAESYIDGFSGYGLECLIIQYGTFERMLRELVKVKKGERIVLDPAKFYKKKDNVFFELNESKLHSPIILVDPTWKDRNVLAALSWETFRKFQDGAKKFLKKPSRKFFEIKEFDASKMKKKDGEFIHVVLETDRQKGDIAGTKMKKFSRYLVRELGKFYEIKDSTFVYKLGKNADFYLVVKSKGEILRVGPPLDRKDDVRKFKQKNKGKTFVKNGVLHARVKVDASIKNYLKKFKVKDKKKIKEMGITNLTVN